VKNLAADKEDVRCYNRPLTVSTQPEDKLDHHTSQPSNPKSRVAKEKIKAPHVQGEPACNTHASIQEDPGQAAAQPERKLHAAFDTEALRLTAWVQSLALPHPVLLNAEPASNKYSHEKLS
jgi:hypothetical protein